MAYWKFNPPEPCGNPSAGWCQATPCRWKVTGFQGPFSEADVLISGTEKYPVVPFVLHGTSSSERVLRNNGAIVHDSGHGPPFYRLWSGFAAQKQKDGTPDASYVAGFAFGYWNFLIPAPDELSNSVPVSRFGMLSLGQTEKSSAPKHPATATRDAVYLSGKNLWLYDPSYSGRWNCWGENRLYYSFLQVGVGLTFDAGYYVTITPDL